MRTLLRVLTPIAVIAALLQSGHAHAVAAVVTPNDPLFEHCSDPACVDEQWNLMSDGRGISADRAWTKTLGQGAVIADIDTGINFSQPDLANQIWLNGGELGTDAQGHDKRSNGIDDDHNGYVDDWRGWDFYEQDNDPTDDVAYGHGTGTSGIAVAEQNNGVGLSGVAPKAKLMVLRTSDSIIHSSARVAQAIRYAADNGANVITMSLGATGVDRTLTAAVNYAESKNVVMVAAMANEFSVHANSPTYLDPVIGVGAIVPDTAGTGASTASSFTVKGGYSNYGPNIDVVAPSNVYTTSFDGGFGKGGGTSSATPHVAGVAALVIARAMALGLSLSSQEVTQIIRASADDLVGSPYDYAAGWDRYTGWGRVNAARAVNLVSASGLRIPPVADINSPDWFQTVSGAVDVKGTVSARNGPSTWSLFAGSGQEPSTFHKIGSGSFPGPFTGTLATFDPIAYPDGLTTLYLKVTDANNHVGADRQAFVLLRDPSLLRGFPKNLHASAGPPQFADLNKDGKDELIVADLNGKVNAFESNGSRLAGWPVSADPTGTPTGTAPAGFTGGVAVSDLNGDGSLDVVAAGGLDGKVYAWDATGHPLSGWPVATTAFVGPDPASPHLESAVFSTPVVTELDGDTTDGQEVLVQGGDGKVYAFHADGSAVAGWPVSLRDPNTPGSARVKGVSSPAVGDIGGDGQPEVVVGSAETYGSTVRVYAFNANGTLHAGWPVSISGVSPNGTPVVAQGVPQSPVLTDVGGDGKMEVAISGFTTRFHLFSGDGTEYPGGASGQYFSNVFGSNNDTAAADVRSTATGLAIGDLDGDGSPDLVSGGVGTNLFGASIYEGRKIDFDHVVSAWHMGTGLYFSAFPRKVEDWMFLTAPILADVNGDDHPEVVQGNGDGWVHAFGADGSEPPGWPKFLGQWIQASAAAGDMNGDGSTDIAVSTRLGNVFVFSTNGTAAGRQWPSFRGTPGNTGVFMP